MKTCRRGGHECARQRGNRPAALPRQPTTRCRSRPIETGYILAATVFTLTGRRIAVTLDRLSGKLSPRCRRSGRREGAERRGMGVAESRRAAGLPLHFLGGGGREGGERRVMGMAKGTRSAVLAFICVAGCGGGSGGSAATHVDGAVGAGSGAPSDSGPTPLGSSGGRKES